ncbi:PE-PPE domain-containing protein [Gordonia sp. N1V]|uniref:PE-PPE domain-containing protein n=1 Tax=Gordonia sp. N1V TaxID=3034163 RepID=UPI0023E1850D|nr:PE-PPE domain-containing protein [Gordonia sp. N1V]MDF3281889.1 PE-PPE domain-containing protein [Gordonia sp. N1V]
MYGVRKAVASTAAGCALCLGAVVPMTLSATTAAAGAGVDGTIAWLEDQGVVRAATPDDCPVAPAGDSSGDQSGATTPIPDPCPDWLSVGDPHADRSAIIVVTPGTDDGTLYPRIKGMRAGRETIVIDYPEALAPLTSGRSGAVLPIFAPTYDQSRDIAVANNLTVMREFQKLAPTAPHVVYTGYSQGAEALGNAAEQAVGSGSIDTASSHIILISDPRSPWGLKAWAAEQPLVGAFFEAFGAESNGARDPGATGDQLPVTSVIVVGDPVANFQWVWYRPVSSLLVDAAGFITIHSGMGADNYGDLIDYSQEPTTLYSQDGNTTYLVYQPDHHPLTMLAMLVNDELGIGYDTADVARWDKVNNAFYPLQGPAVDNAAVPVVISPDQRTASSPQARTASAPDTAAPLGDTAPPSQPAPPSQTAPLSQAVAPSETTAPQQDSALTAPTTAGRHRAPEAPGGDQTSTTQTGTTQTGSAGTGEQSPADQPEQGGGRHRLQGSGRHADTVTSGTTGTATTGTADATDGGSGDGGSGDGASGATNAG